MSKAIIITEDQYSRLLNVIDNNSYIFEDYAADLQKRMQAGAKQATINATKCPTNYKALTPQEIKNYSSYQIKPWLDTRTMNKNWKVLSNGTVCKIIQTTFAGGGSEIDIHKVVEAIRSGMGSLAGIVIQTLLDLVPPVGPALNVGAWSLLLSYDIYMGFTYNKWDYFNIIVDLIGIATTGPGAGIAKKYLGSLAKYGKGKLSTFLQAVKKYSPEGFKYIFGLLKSSTSWIGKIATQMTSIINAVGTKLKGSSFYQTLVLLKNNLAKVHKIIHEVEGNLLLLGAKVVTKVGEKYAEHKVVHAGVGKVTGHGHGGDHGGQHGGSNKAVTQAVQKGLAKATSNLNPKTTIPRYITVNGIKKPNPKFKQAYGYV
jgi:hypothetical protein